MNVFPLRPDCNRYQNLVFASKKDWVLLRQFDEGRLIQSWTPPFVEILREDKFNRNLPPSDFPHLAVAVPVFSLKAVNVLRGMLEENGEILPLSCTEGEYYAFHVTTFIDALDESNSEVERFKTDGSIMQVLKYAFCGNRLSGATIFKIPQFPGSEVYVTDKFRKLVIDSGLLGFEFINVWEG